MSFLSLPPLPFQVPSADVAVYWTNILKIRINCYGLACRPYVHAVDYLEYTNVLDAVTRGKD